jgi:hypothetical protein
VSDEGGGGGEDSEIGVSGESGENDHKLIREMVVKESAKFLYLCWSR